MDKQLLSGFNMPCQVCKEPSKSQCPSCRTPYCSKACQRVDWKRGHKAECKEMTAEFQRGYNYVEPLAKKKEAPPVVVIPESVRPTVDTKHATKEPLKAVEEKAPSGRESCPICLDFFSTENLAYFGCCGHSICNVCATKCYETNPLCPLCRVPFPTNEAEELAQLQRKVARGDKVAQSSLGGAYEHGQLGLEKSMQQAAQLYELAAAQGQGRAQTSLGRFYYLGRGVQMDKKKALHYFTLAAEQSDAEAQHNCGLMYFEGEGAERDVKEALRYFELAAAQGHLEAQNTVIMLHWQANARR